MRPDHPKDTIIARGRGGTGSVGQYRRLSRSEWDAEGVNPDPTDGRPTGRDAYWMIERVEPFVPWWRSPTVLAAVAIATLLVATATLVVAILALTDHDPAPVEQQQEESSS